MHATAAAKHLNSSVGGGTVESAFSVTKPISENPKFSETLQEELRSRLLLIKQALQKSQNDQEFFQIQNAFTNKSMKVFKDLVSICQSLDQDQITKIVIERLQEGKSADLAEAVERYAEYFIAEFAHFLRMHGFVRAKKPTLTQEQKVV